MPSAAAPRTSGNEWRRASAGVRFESRAFDRLDDRRGLDGAASYSTVAAFFSSDTSTRSTPGTLRDGAGDALDAALAMHAVDGEFAGLRAHRISSFIG